MIQSAIATATATPGYTVVDGDTLSVIAQRFNTTVEALVNANQLTNADEIVAGQILAIAAPAVITATSSPTR